MGKNFILFLAHTALFSLSLSGQCPDRDSLWKRLIWLKNSADAVPLAEQLKELKNYEAGIKSCPYHNDSTHAFLLQRIGTIYYMMADYPHAIQYTLQSVSMIERYAPKPLAHRNRLTYCYDYFNLETYYDSLNRVKEKNATSDSCIATAIRFDLVDKDILDILQYRIKDLFYVGDYQRCIRYTDLGELLTSQYLHGRDSLVFAMFLLNWEANVLIFFKKYDVAATLLFSKTGVCEKAGAIKETGDIYSQIADTYKGLGDYKKSIFYYQKALSYHQAAKDFLNCKITLNNLGQTHFEYLHDGALALRSYKRAIGYVSPDPKDKFVDALQTLDAFNGMAMIYLQKGNYDSCFANFQTAFDQIRPGIHDSDLLYLTIPEFTQNRNIDLVISLLINKGDAYQQKFLAGKDNDHALTEALRIYRLTDLFLDKLRNEHSETESMLYWRVASRRLYEHAIEACWFAKKTNEAFYFFEKSRSVLLNDQLNELSSLDNEKIAEISQVKRKILQLENGKDQSLLVNELFNRKQELDRLKQLGKKVDHLSYQSFPDSGLNYVRRDLLQDHQVLLELFNGDSAVYTLLVSSGQTRLDRIDRSDFDSTTKLYLSYISNPATLNGNFTRYTGTAHHLYQLIFHETPPKGRIIISQDGRYFPFEALVLNDNPVSPVYFLEDHPTSYTYSASYLMNHFSTQPTATTGNFMGVAPVRYQPSFRLAALNGSDVSLKKISAYFSETHNLVAVQASKDHFFQQFSGYKIIQLYTHASDSSSNGEPVIYFTDSALYLSDLIPKDKPATQLIVLSACETGNGKVRQGEGVFNFNRGFAALGIPSSVTNLWMVEDKATYRLTELFYKQLAAGDPQDIALQKAKMEFIRTASKEDQLPYYWAATILAGKTDPIGYTKPFPWKWILLLAGLGLAGLLFWGWRKLIRPSNSSPDSSMTL